MRILLSPPSPPSPSGTSCLFVLARELRLAGHLILCLLVSMCDKLVQEAAGLALVVAICFSPVNLSAEVACCFIIDIYKSEMR